MPTANQSRSNLGAATPRSRAGRFEDLIAWQKARSLVKEVYLATREPRFARDFALASQIQRAAVSILSNIAEGFERAHPREFHQALAVARATCAEVRAQLYVALDVGYLTSERFESLMNAAAEVGRIIGGLRLSVARRLEAKATLISKD
ncbi:MAG: four helix bundle protein [Phycisphaerales bacterium]